MPGRWARATAVWSICARRGAGTLDEIGNLATLLMGADGAFIAGNDFRIDGGVTASYWFGELAPA